jgi:CBS domain containing-hemolysin-like protein
VIIGVLTLEDVIEKILRIDINDEKDREKAVQAL